MLKRWKVFFLSRVGSLAKSLKLLISSGRIPASANTEETTRRELFKTAGLPLIALLGTVFLGAGLGMKALSGRG